MQNVTKLDGHFAVKGGQLFSSRMHKQRSMDSRLFAMFLIECTELPFVQIKLHRFVSITTEEYLQNKHTMDSKHTVDYTRNPSET